MGEIRVKRGHTAQGPGEAAPRLEL
jgi:hypothetical protein